MSVQVLKQKGVLLLTVLGLLALGWQLLTILGASNLGVQLDLQRPALIHTTYAAEQNLALEKLQEEAGIAAYVKVDRTIDLNQMKAAFRTVEMEEDSYLIGSVSIPDYRENQDVHMYIDSNGWMVAYYLDSDPAAKLFNFKDFRDSDWSTFSTKLENAMQVAAGTVGFTLPEVTYYDFRYPNATTLILIADANTEGYGGTGDSFGINIPSSFEVYDRSVAAERLISRFGGDVVYLNGEPLVDGASQFTSGFINAVDLAPNTDHAIQTQDVGGLALVYRAQ